MGAWIYRRRRWVPYLLLLPGLLWLIVFFAYPLTQVFLASFWTVLTPYLFDAS